MAYRKFDDAPLASNDEARKLYPVFPNEALRRAVQSITNKVISGTGGTNGTGMLSNVGTGSTAGVAIGQTLIASINGRFGTIAAQSNLYLPKGTQGSATYVKYLLAGKFGTAGTVAMGNEGTSSTTAKLPDCPDGYVALGYMEYYTGTGPFIRFGGGTAGGYNVVSGNTGGTCGTVNAWVNLLHMPFSE